ncbi:MAG: N-acetylmuramoyl-L-alanine amidase [Defluviitaleaceae bacterium]|nr:N-acetylmuramoyl-L-alanine amidase [Defluviitaleaceae bacterium]
MQKYRGTRGVRNYAREAEEFKRTIMVLAVLNIGMMLLAGALFVYAIVFAPPVSVPVVAAFADAGFFSPSYENRVFLVEENMVSSPVVPVYWGAGIFFDTETDKIILPLSVSVGEISYSHYHHRQQVKIEGIDFTKGTIPLMPLNLMPLGIILVENELEIRTRRGVFLSYGRTEDFAYIRILDPQNMPYTIVIIDPGHGGRDPGAPSVHGQNAPYEAEIVLDIALKLLEIFDAPGIKLLPTRTEDVFLSTASRARFANSMGDYFISIHNNADARSRLSRGTLTLYGSAHDSRALAEKFQSALHYALQSQNRGVSYAPQFQILRESAIPAVLLELLFLSNPQDADRLACPRYQMLIAQTMADVISELPRVR